MRAPAFRHLPPMDVLALERTRAADVGHASTVDHAIRALLEAPDATSAKRSAARLVIGGQSFFDLITNAASLGYVHAEAHRHDMPQGRALAGGELASLLFGAARADPKAYTKIRDGFRERLHLSWHTLANDREWHCFFYSHRDVGGDPFTGEHHWEHGPHIHYSSHRLSRLSREAFVGLLGAEVDRRPSGEHIRFQSAFAAASLEP